MFLVKLMLCFCAVAAQRYQIMVNMVNIIRVLFLIKYLIAKYLDDF
jgi:hypothetical protein